MKIEKLIETKLYRKSTIYNFGLSETNKLCKMYIFIDYMSQVYDM